MTNQTQDNTADFAYLMEQVAVERCQHAYRKIFEHFAPRVHAFCLRQQVNDAQAHELVQETMANVWRKANLYDRSRGQLSTWIFTIVRNLRFDMLRKQQVRKEEVCSEDLWPVLEQNHVAEEVLDADDRQTLDELYTRIKGLPAKQQQVLEAVYIQGKSQQEIADDLNVPLGTIKSRVRLGLQRLKEVMEVKE